MFGLDSFFKEPYQDLQDKYKSMLLQVDHILIISYLLILFKQEIFSLLLSQTYLPGYPQIYIWVGFLIHMYILVPLFLMVKTYVIAKFSENKRST